MSASAFMIVNTKYNFIFVHIPKTAGTSITSALAAVPGNNANWTAKTKHESLSDFYGNVSKRRPIFDRITTSQPENYFSFGFVRNPWDRMASLYRYLVEKRPRAEIDSVASFKDFLLQAASCESWIRGLHSLRPQIDYFTLDDNIMKLDFLGHYEYLQEDFSSIVKSIGLAIGLPERNVSSNRLGDYKIEYDDDMIEIVASLFAEEIAYFGYSFDERYPGKRCSAPICFQRAQKTFIG